MRQIEIEIEREEEQQRKTHISNMDVLRRNRMLLRGSVHEQMRQPAEQSFYKSYIYFVIPSLKEEETPSASSQHTIRASY